MNNDPKAMVEAGYDRVAHDYARLEGETKWPRMRWLRKLLNQLPPGSSVLDLGCGSGDPADIEVAKEHKITGVGSVHLLTGETLKIVIDNKETQD